MKLAAADVISKFGRPDIVHAHDWLSAIAAFFVKYAYRTPLVSTIHSTEYGRRRGIHEDHQRTIHELESKLVYESWRVVCCSNFMKYQIMDVFNCPGDKIDVIPNGVVKEEFDSDFDRNELKSRFASPDQKIILCVGRMVPEKGFDVLLGAARFIIHKHNVKFICVGDGYMKGKYLDDARFLDVYNNFYFTGYLDDETLKHLYQIADVVVVPSRYEPFGIVALEAMAARTPVVVSDTGGLSEIVWHDHDGLKVWPGHSESLAWGINRVLDDPGHADWLVKNAHLKVTEVFNWGNVARRTRETYLKTLSEFYISEWVPDVRFSVA
jgi:glycogen(starch) synthase